MIRVPGLVVLAVWAGALVALAGLVTALGVAVAPWAGWAVALACSAILAWRLTERYYEAREAERARADGAGVDPPGRYGAPADFEG